MPLAGDRVLHSFVRIEQDANLNTARRGDETLRLNVFPRCVEALGPDERKDVALFTVFTHECCGETESAACLKVGREFEHGRRKEVHLVVDDQTPIVGVEERQVCELALSTGRQDVIGRDCDGLDLFAFARILANVVFSQGRSRKDFVTPLAGRNRVCHKNQR